MIITPTIPNNIATDDIKWWEETFLAVLSKHCNVSKACEACKYPDGRSINRSTAYDHYNASERFQKLWNDALAKATDKLRETAFKLANGEFKMKEGTQEEYTLPPNTPVLLRLLEAHDPNYRAVSRSEITGKDGGAIQTQNLTPEGVTQADVDRLIDEYVQRRSNPTITATNQP